MSTVMASNEAPLPVSTKALKKIAEANSWLEHDELQRSKSAAFAWKLVVVAILLALMGWGLALFLSTRPTPAPVTIVVDRTTGESMVVGSFDGGSVPQLSSVDQHWIAVYVRACDSYHFNLLKTDYDQCARMSSADVFEPYSKQFQGDSAKQTVMGAKEDDTVSLVSIRMTSDTKPGRSGEAIATYDKETTNSQGLPPTTVRFVETLRFEYRPSALASPIDRLENPFGFVVLAKRTDQELVSPVPEPEKAKPTSQVSR